MNILLYVLSMLMIFSLLTYAKLDLYQSKIPLQIFYQKTLPVLQKKALSSGQEKLYEKHHISKEKKEGDPKEATRNPFTSKLSLFPLFDPQQRGTFDLKKKQTAFLFKKLLERLYGGKPLLEKMEQTQLGLIETIVESLLHVSNFLPQAFKVQQASDLTNLPLENPIVQDALYRMLKGDPARLSKKDRPDEEADVSLDETLKEGQELFQDNAATPSLSDYITFKPSPGIRVYLASKDLLSVIFGDLGVAESILSTREELYKQVLTKQKEAKEASEEFKMLFLSKRDPSIDPAFLNFEVTKINPKNYN